MPLIAHYVKVPFAVTDVVYPVLAELRVPNKSAKWKKGKQEEDKDVGKKSMSTFSVVSVASF